ncbi:MAG: hypothetical protein JXA07_09500 [Spirochaetes bacterium]|nr:hypothetical protein [Spirochaetota bacterium]
MKEKDVRVDYRKHQVVLYAEKRDGSYGPVRTGSYITKNYLDDYWLKRNNLEREYLEKVRGGEISPIAYYMVLEELTPSELASRVKLSTRKVKRHMTPEHFGEATVEQLRRYCEVFNVPIAGMFQAVVTRKKGVRVEELKTDNPYFSIYTIATEKK